MAPRFGGGEQQKNLTLHSQRIGRSAASTSSHQKQNKVCVFVEVKVRGSYFIFVKQAFVGFFVLAVCSPTPPRRRKNGDGSVEPKTQITLSNLRSWPTGMCGTPTTGAIKGGGGEVCRELSRWFGRMEHKFAVGRNDRKAISCFHFRAIIIDWKSILWGSLSCLLPLVFPHECPRDYRRSIIWWLASPLFTSICWIAFRAPGPSAERPTMAPFRHSKKFLLTLRNSAFSSLVRV